MRARKYAAAVDLYSNPRSALLTWLSGARLRVGGARRVRRYLYTHPTVTPREIRSAIDHHLHYLRPLGVSARATRPVLELTDAERVRARERLGDCGVVGDAERTVGLHPGGKWEVKRWPVERFADLARRLVEHHGVRIVVLIGPNEQSYQDALRADLGPRAVYLPPLPIRDTAAVIDALDAVVVGDGGIMHVSVAVGTPTVGLFGSSEPDIWFPYESFGPFAAAFVPIDCRPCHRHTCGHLSCLRGLSAGMVEEKLVRVMGAVGTNERTIHR
jgi:ADP-heptose:LPS heptosyltransferase